ncbi:MAG: SgcJ/EcaC family oxidoreductase [Acidobacteria bacterium]|nr:SgcJ/EcaC family oxidoreductase [Acidobacteriota bacterium]
MTRAELQTIFDRYMDTWKRRDPVALAAYHAPDGVVESPMYQTRRGRKEIEDAYRAFLTSFPDQTHVVEAVLIDPPRIASFSTISATHVNDFFGLPGTNKRIEIRHSRLFEIDDSGLIVHERRIYDFMGVLVKVGVLRAKPA